MSVPVSVTVSGPCQCALQCPWTSAELVSFSMSVFMSVTVSTTLIVRCGVRVSDRIRVRDNARYRCCSHVRVSGSNRCGVAYVPVAEFDRVCDNACFHCCFHDNVSDIVTSDLVISDQWPVTSDLVRTWSSLCPCPCPVSMTNSVSVSMSMSGPYPSVSNRVRVCFRVLAHVSDCRSVYLLAWPPGHVSVRDGVGVHDRDRVPGRVRYILSVSFVVPIMSSARGCGRDSWP